jgi:hypothetical protein
METTNNKLKRYAVSTGLTFVVAFLAAFLTAMVGVIDAGTSLSGATFFSLMSGAFIAALRVVAKYLIEKLEMFQPPVVSRGRK